jgi:hypothetical protein
VITCKTKIEITPEPRESVGHSDGRIVEEECITAYILQPDKVLGIRTVLAVSALDVAVGVGALETHCANGTTISSEHLPLTHSFHGQSPDIPFQPYSDLQSTHLLRGLVDRNGVQSHGLHGVTVGPKHRSRFAAWSAG